MLNTLQRYRARKEGDDNELGFTLIELLIVIVVLGILAAVTVFALSGVTGTSAQAACNSDAATVNTAVAAYDANTGYSPAQTGNVPPAPTATASGNLVVAATGGQVYLQSWPTSSHYTIGLTSTGTVTVTGLVNTANGAVNWVPGTTSTACTKANVS